MRPLVVFVSKYCLVRLKSSSTFPHFIFKQTFTYLPETAGVLNLRFYLFNRISKAARTVT